MSEHGAQVYRRGRGLRRLARAIALGGVAVVVAGTLLTTTGSTRVVSTAQAGSTADSLAALAAGLPVGSEIPSLRTQTSDTFVGDNGTFVARVYSGAVNYKDASGNWQPIDNSLHAGSDGTAPGFDNGANRFQLQLPQQIQGAPVRLTNGNDWVGFSLDGATGAGSVSGRRETFAGALSNVDATYTSFGDGVDQDLVLQSPSAQRTFSYTIKTSPGLTAQTTPEGSITFTDSSGQNQFTVQPPIMSDANGASSAPGDASYQLSSTSSGYELAVNADSAWLSSADRAWPVTIDPTTLVLSSYMDTFIRSTNPNTNYYGQTTDKVGWDTYGVRRALLYFDVQDTLPSGAQVLDATMNLYLSAESTTANVQVGAYAATQGWTTYATWNDWFPPYTWATPGGDYDSSFGTQTGVGGSLGAYSWDLSELAYDWEENTTTNNGILLKDVDETTGLNLFSFNSGVASSNWPVLNVDYTTTADEADINGTTETDQSAATGVLGLAPYPAGPAQVHGNGGAGSYPTDYWSPDETDTPDGLQVVNTTGANTWGVSGDVIDDSTGNEISGATVTLSSSTTTLTTTSNSTGAFSFVDVPQTTPWTISISAAGYGTYTDTNFSPLNNETYEATISMTTAAQTYDLSGQADDNSPLAISTTVNYASQTRVPPTIRVAIHQQLAGCATGSYIKTRTFPWRYYLLHVTAAETHYSDWPANVIKANMEAQQSFAWYYKIHQPLTEVGDVTNTTSTQCFKPQNLPLAHWAQWVNDVFQSRIAQNGDIQQTSYKSGTPVSQGVCDPEYHQNNMYQWGSLSLGTTCVSTMGSQYNNWKNIDNYYYTGSVRPSYRPTTPTTSFSRPSGKVTLNFASKVRNGLGYVSNVAWNYQLERYISGSWRQIFYSKWEGAPEQNKSAIPLTYTYTPGGCYKYRVRGINPVGHSYYASFNNGSQICPG